jgi:mutator protein MutT
MEKNIRISSAVLIIEKGKILLGKRNKKPGFGQWVLPGGKIEFRETHQEAAKREAKEELGLSVEITRLAGKGIYHFFGEETHRIIIYNIANKTGGIIKPASDISEAKFFSKQELIALNTTSVVLEVLKDGGWID